MQFRCYITSDPQNVARRRGVLPYMNSATIKGEVLKFGLFAQLRQVRLGLTLIPFGDGLRRLVRRRSEGILSSSNNVGKGCAYDNELRGGCEFRCKSFIPLKQATLAVEQRRALLEARA